MSDEDRDRPEGRDTEATAEAEPAASPPAEAPEDDGVEPSTVAFPVVGIGASAGGLAAFEAFLSALPDDAEPDMAFVLVQHLAPNHESLLRDLVRGHTRMEVLLAEDGMAVQRGHAYVIPPNADLALLHGRLQVLTPSAPRGHRFPVDFFFRSLAQDLGPRAIGIVLSGTGSDGAEGARAIKGEGGMVLAQSPETTEFDGMPRSAIATGMVDFVLPPEEMPERILAYAARAFGEIPGGPASAYERDTSALRKVFVLLRSSTGHDFSEYKPSTIQRRVRRRMALQDIDSVDAYLQRLREQPQEIDALFGELLIGVTRFFRDPEAFAALQAEVIPEILEGRPPDEPVRVWVPGCSTGEEAYSIAILLQEGLDTLHRDQQIQIFATDIDPQAVAAGRAGIYPAGIAADLTAERLSRFFSEAPGGGAWRVRKSLRDLLIFSEQDLLRDPPFSHLDLVSCRNLLIYLGSDLQRELIPLFHYALDPGGYLFLGSSESVGDASALFTPVDRRWKIYRRCESVRPLGRPRFGRLPTAAPGGTLAGAPAPRRPARERRPVRELAEQALLRHLAPVGVLVDREGDVLYLHGRAGRFLEPSTGESGTANVLRMARPGLARPLTSALHRARASGEVARSPGLRVQTEGGEAVVDLTVRPVPIAADARAYLVVLDEAAAERTPEPALEEGIEGESPDARIATLRQELQAKEEYLQTTVEELETSNEELRSSNEEMQSLNEEMQSTNEELETSKEELQSVNEELATVNAELQAKVSDLSQANNDMNNLLAGTGIATVFVDHQLRIFRFTPAATQLINLIPSDVGRPLGHVVTNLAGYDDLVTDVQAVLDDLVPVEHEVRARDGRWFAMRIQPYRTLENVIEGAVITFVDVSEVNRARSDLARSQLILHTSEAIVHVGGFAYDPRGERLFWTPELYRLLDLEPGALKTDRARREAWLKALGPGDGPRLTTALARCAGAGEPFDLTCAITTERGHPRTLRIVGRAVGPAGEDARVAGCVMETSSTGEGR